jgi:hypothetical protein
MGEGGTLNKTENYFTHVSVSLSVSVYAAVVHLL